MSDTAALLAALWVQATLIGQFGGSGSKGETEWRFFERREPVRRASQTLGGTNARKRRGLSTSSLWSSRSFTPA